MKSLKKLSLVLVFLFAMASLFAGCGNKDAANKQEATQSSKEIVFLDQNDHEVKLKSSVNRILLCYNIIH